MCSDLCSESVSASVSVSVTAEIGRRDTTHKGYEEQGKAIETDAPRRGHRRPLRRCCGGDTDDPPTGSADPPTVLRLLNRLSPSGPPSPGAAPSASLTLRCRVRGVVVAPGARTEAAAPMGSSSMTAASVAPIEALGEPPKVRRREAEDAEDEKDEEEAEADAALLSETVRVRRPGREVGALVPAD